MEAVAQAVSCHGRAPDIHAEACAPPQDMAAVAQAVRDSPLQLQARVEGNEIMVPVPK